MTTQEPWKPPIENLVEGKRYVFEVREANGTLSVVEGVFINIGVMKEALGVKIKTGKKGPFAFVIWAAVTTCHQL